MFKSCNGLRYATLPRDISFCGHVILSEAPLIVADARQDIRFNDNPLVLGEPHIRFYAGCPLRLPDGTLVGSFCWLDLDEFKQINDNYGHAEGDVALREMARLLIKRFRDTDLLVRHGGDEFGILFSDTDESGTWIAMQHLTEEANTYNLTSGKPWKLAFSWGIIEFNHDGITDLSGWLRAEDKRMYAMKRTHESNHRLNK